MRKIISMVLSFILAVSLSAGCGVKEDGNGALNGSQGGSGDSPTSEAASDVSPVSLGENMLSVREIRSIHFEKPEEGYRVSNTFWDFMDGKVWMFRVEFLNENGIAGKQRVCMQVYDSSTKKVKQQVLAPEIEGHDEYWISSVGLTDQGEISFKMEEQAGEERTFFLVKTDVEGQVLEVTAPFPNEEDYPWNMDWSSQTKVFHLADGRTVISRWDEEAQTAVLTWFDSGKAGQELGRLAGEQPAAFCCDKAGILYFMTGNSLIRWDTEKNQKEELFGRNENGVGFSSHAGLFLTDDGELLFCTINEGEYLAYVLTDEEIVHDEELRLSYVLDPTDGQSYLPKCVAKYAHETGGFPVVVEKEQEKYQEDYRNRIFAELAAGKGPDILYLSREDLQLLAEKGALCDLSDMIPEDVKEVMIPAALELGVVDGKMVGFTPQVEFLSLITADAIWAEDSWSLDEFLEAAESVEDWEIMIWYLGRDLTGTMLLDILMSDVENASLLDLEQGVSYLDGDKFVRILELCKQRRQSNREMDREEFIGLMKEGKGMAEWRWISDLSSFSAIMESYGEDCSLVGYPAERGSGNYARAAYPYGYLAVNANTEHKEEIGKFFAYLLDYDKQFSVDDCSVRMDVIRNSVLYNEIQECYMMRISDNADHMVVRNLAAKPDGNTWLEEYLEFLENCRPQPVLPGQISKIISEELSAFLEGDKSAEETAEIMHRRVQLYLDETR